MFSRLGSTRPWDTISQNIRIGWQHQYLLVVQPLGGPEGRCSLGRNGTEGLRRPTDS